MNDPVAYHDNLETVAEDESETIEDMNETMRTILDRVAKDESHAYRSVHAKSHGIIAGKLRIHDDLPDELRQGIFAAPGTHDAILRISTNPGDLLHDGVSVPRGLALKVLNVEGERLDTDYESASQDFVMINGPAFSAKSAREFAKTLKLLAATTDRAEWGKKLLSRALQGVGKVLEDTVGASATIQTLGGAPNTHPLGETFYTQTAYRYGDYVAKLQLVPVSQNLRSLSGKEIDTAGRPDALREDIDRTMRSESVEWDLRVQLLRDLDKQPVEDATVVWDEIDFPFATVATVTANSQPAWTQKRSAAVDDAMRFAPWNGIAAHRPMGSINRARKSPYDRSAAFRERVNGRAIRDPDRADHLG
ncbi:catalase family protein [Fulvimarina sp. 2208YS6-2-32]|uniref:Catalase family protein n=1 Tax=Fulvimarina uroteuthidis TaxID=3098149 RepID=A0ABU5I431_9HYPH|nr:catalase family protein [Fulvimarina sp. 2208YS6-2-32]MDY8110146.1 catalase family protein [Fulvimarina sp. 2208YS6-2-32]